jgi:hypothetical protein
MPVDILSHPHEVFYERALHPSLEKTVVQKGVLLYDGGQSYAKQIRDFVSERVK